ncbi:MAG: hypothetical protein WBQ34_15885 [Candidatus Acidiferrales bacterium]
MTIGAGAVLMASALAALSAAGVGLLIAVGVTTVGVSAAWAQTQSQGPLPPPPKFEVKRIPAVPHPGPPPIPVATIIQKFAANEDAEKKIYEGYDFVQDVRIEELSNPGGSFETIGEMYTRPDGKRYWRVLRPINSTLKFTSFTMDDVQDIVSQPLFFLTSDQVQYYDFLYAGQTQLDQLAPYVFQVKPKQLSPKRVFFQGVIYVDNVDLAVVETYGKFVGEFYEKNSKLPFDMYDIYYQNLQGHYWFPTYVSSDAYLTEKDGSELHLRLVVRSSEFKAAAPSPAAASPAQPAEPTQGPPPKNQ